MKRGQFYIIAAFVIVIVLSGLTYIYTRAESPNKNIDLKGIAKEVDFEMNSAINNAVLEGLNDNEITARMRTIGDYYLDRYPAVDLIVVYGDNKNAYVVSGGDQVSMCDAEGVDVEAPRTAVKGRLAQGDAIGKCNGQMANKDMGIKTEANQNKVAVFSLSGERVEVDMGNERKLYVILSNVQGDESNFVIV